MWTIANKKDDHLFTTFVSIKHTKQIYPPNNKMIKHGHRLYSAKKIS